MKVEGHLSQVVFIKTSILKEVIRPGMRNAANIFWPFDKNTLTHIPAFFFKR
jgi:hypothetical protein